MKWAPIFLLTGVITGLYNFYLLMNVVNGAPINLLNCISLSGSLALLATGVLLPFQPRASSKIGLAGSILTWVFYAPFILVSLIEPFSTGSEIRLFFKFHEYVPIVGMLIGPALLIPCTFHSFVLSRQGMKPRRVP